MKMVSGRVMSSKPVSLSKAARSLSKFVSSDNGASPAFAAYLKRASVSFGELVQLHKELKGSGSEFKGKKKHFPDGIITEETVNSVKKPSVNGLSSEEKLGTSDRKNHKESKRGEVRAREIEGDGSVGIRTGKQASEVTKKKKKDKGQREESDGSLKIKQEEDGSLSRVDVNGEATDIVENGFSELKKHKSKKGKDEKENSGIANAEETDPIDGGSANNRNGTEGGEDKKHKKKRSHREEEIESEGKVENEEADKKESRKRKHKGSAHGGLDDSEEQHRSKKKKTIDLK